MKNKINCCPLFIWPCSSSDLVKSFPCLHPTAASCGTAAANCCSLRDTLEEMQETSAMLRTWVTYFWLKELHWRANSLCRARQSQAAVPRVPAGRAAKTSGGPSQKLLFPVSKNGGENPSFYLPWKIRKMFFILKKTLLCTLTFSLGSLRKWVMSTVPLTILYFWKRWNRINVTSSQLRVWFVWCSSRIMLRRWNRLRVLWRLKPRGGVGQPLCFIMG